MPTSGFHNAPVMKVLIGALCGFFLLGTYTAAPLSALDIRIDSKAMFQRHEYWRILAAQLTFQSGGEMLVGVLLLYMFRQFERQLGTSKFSLHVIVSTAIACTLQVALISFAPSLQYMSPGPYALIFALFPKYIYYVPKIHPRLFSIFGVNLSDKFLCYLFGLQLLFCDGWHSIAAAAPGFLVGSLFVGESSLLQNYSLPRSINRQFARWVLPLVASRAPGSRRVSAQRRARTAEVATGNQETPRLPLATVVPRPPLEGTGAVVLPGGALPNEAAIGSLMGLAQSMGLDRAEVVRALRASDNSVQQAANLLITSGSRNQS